MTAMKYNEELKFRKHRKKHLHKLKEMVRKGDLLMILKMSREGLQDSTGESKCKILQQERKQWKYSSRR